MSKYYVYKWVHDGQIVYVGKTMNPAQRFLQESRVDKFQPYLDSDLYITETTNSTEMSGLEKLLINKYAPVLNVVDKHEQRMELPVDDESLVWTPYPNPVTEAKKKAEQARKEAEEKRIDAEIMNTYYDYLCRLAQADILSNWQSMIAANISNQTFAVPFAVPEAIKASQAYEMSFRATNVPEDAGRDSTDGVSIADILNDSDFELYEPHYSSWDQYRTANASAVKVYLWSNNAALYSLRIGRFDEEEFRDDHLYYFEDPMSTIIFIELSGMIEYATELAAMKKDEYEELLRKYGRKDKYLNPEEASDNEAAA